MQFAGCLVCHWEKFHSPYGWREMWHSDPGRGMTSCRGSAVAGAAVAAGRWGRGPPELTSHPDQVRTLSPLSSSQENQSTFHPEKVSNPGVGQPQPQAACTMLCPGWVPNGVCQAERRGTEHFAFCHGKLKPPLGKAEQPGAGDWWRGLAGKQRRGCASFIV